MKPLRLQRDTSSSIETVTTLVLSGQKVVEAYHRTNGRSRTCEARYGCVAAGGVRLAVIASIATFKSVRMQE